MQLDIKSQKREQTGQSDLDQSATKKRRTIEDAILAAGLDPQQTSQPTGQYSIFGSLRPSSIPIQNMQNPYQGLHPQNGQSYQNYGNNTYPNYQFNNYYTQNTYPLVGIFLF